jgi:hypothetical protein
LLNRIDRISSRGGLGEAIAARGGLGEAITARGGLGEAIAARGGLGEVIAARGGLGEAIKPQTLVLRRVAALRFDAENLQMLYLTLLAKVSKSEELTANCHYISGQLHMSINKQSNLRELGVLFLCGILEDDITLLYYFLQESTGNLRPISVDSVSLNLRVGKGLACTCMQGLGYTLSPTFPLTLLWQPMGSVLALLNESRSCHAVFEAGAGPIQS